MKLRKDYVRANVTFLGITFSTLGLDSLLKKVKKGGLVLAPSGPGLAFCDKDRLYYQACKNASIVLPDSGLAILLCKILNLGALPRISGLGFLTFFLKSFKGLSPPSFFWVFPSCSTKDKALPWLNSIGIKTNKNYYYIAPVYSKVSSITDNVLLRRIKNKKPRFVFLCIGGGPQEKLGYWLSKNLSYRPAVICIGGAIGFLCGDQANIPLWADRLCLGWFLRCLSKPGRFVPRYASAFRLIYLAMRYREKSPPLM